MRRFIFSSCFQTSALGLRPLHSLEKLETKRIRNCSSDIHRWRYTATRRRPASDLLSMFLVSLMTSSRHTSHFIRLASNARATKRRSASVNASRQRSRSNYTLKTRVILRRTFSHSRVTRNARIRRNLSNDDSSKRRGCRICNLGWIDINMRSIYDS